MENKRLNFRQRILVAGTLFGMFFGAGNLIFPVHLGQLAGSNWIAATVGFIVTAVGIPILGVAAIGNTHSDGLQALARKVGKPYSYFFTILLYLTIGPFFAIPRCCTVSFTTGIEPIIQGNVPSWIVLMAFSAVFFAFVMFFSLRPGKITVWIGKIINPVFLVFLGILVVTALLNPSASTSSVQPTEAYENGAFFSGIIEGYGTMDAIAGLAFGIVVVDIVRSFGVERDLNVKRDVLRSGILTGVLMAIIYVFTILIGTQSMGFTSLSENGGIAFREIAAHYLGSAGSIILAVTITFACLKTSIGLVTSCSEAFHRMFPKLSYRVWAVIFTVFSFVVSNIGLSAIISYSLPVLMLIYPPAITLILLALFTRHFKNDWRVYHYVMVFTWLASIFDFLKTLPDNVIDALHLEPVIEFGRTVLPFFDQNLGWVVPALIGLAIGLILHFTVSKKHLKVAK